MSYEFFRVDRGVGFRVDRDVDFFTENHREKSTEKHGGVKCTFTRSKT
jgi:hypothetical protein